MFEEGGGTMTKFMYKYVTAKTDGFFRVADYKETIDKMAEEGWRFVSGLPARQSQYGAIIELDLVFDKEDTEAF